jgi:hypothetical protein
MVFWKITYGKINSDTTTTGYFSDAQILQKLRDKGLTISEKASTLSPTKKSEWKVMGKDDSPTKDDAKKTDGGHTDCPGETFITNGCKYLYLGRSAEKEGLVADCVIVLAECKARSVDV